jgi:pimeloyl-ACP methyl ester carboxylesterase
MMEIEDLNAPVILVGHSFGGLIVRVFQQRHPALVAGMVLVDPVLRSEWKDAPAAKRQSLARGVLLSKRGALLARLGIVRFALNRLTSGSSRLPKLMAKLSAGNGAPVTDRLAGEVRKMPRELWPAIAQHWSQPQSFLTMADYLESLPLSAAQLDDQATLGDLPLAVLSARKPNDEHRHDAELSTRSRYIVVPGAGHWIQLDAPDAVIEAVLEVVNQVRG